MKGSQFFYLCSVIVGLTVSVHPSISLNVAGNTVNPRISPLGLILMLLDGGLYEGELVRGGLLILVKLSIKHYLNLE